MPVEHSPPVPVAFVTGTLELKPGLCGEAEGLLLSSAELKCHYMLSAVLGAC